jgi:large subunit ribosomal protein L21
MTQTTTAASGAGAPAAATPAAAPYAIVEASGQQFWLQPNRYYDLDRIGAEVDDTVTLENVLLVNDGKATTLGQPYVSGASVELKVMAHRRGPKIIVYKMRPKKKTRRKNGHRQELTRVMVQSITVAGKPLA